MQKKRRRAVPIPDGCIPETIDRLLATEFWLRSLVPETGYVRLHDDHNGTYQGTLRIVLDKMGEVQVIAAGANGLVCLRFRTSDGGGVSLNTRKALLILAEAIRMDNKERPINMSSGAVQDLLLP
jgi:hypothetical protein